MENQTQKFTQTLRFAGVLAIVASSVLFLVQGLTALSSFERYLSFAGITALMAGLGIFAGSKLNESKGARTFLGLAAAATPVLFAQLGAMIHSLVMGSTSTSLPQAFLVTAPSIGAIGAALGVTVLLLLPILFVGFRTFFREKASFLVGALLLSSACLLIPFRDADGMAFLVCLQTIGLLGMTLNSKSPNHSRLESALGGLLPLLPVTILIGRQMYYSTSNFFGASVFLLLAFFFGRFLPFLVPKDARVLKSKALGVLSLGAGWICFSAGVLEFFHAPKSVDLLLMTYPVIVGALLTPMFLQPQFRSLRRFFEFMAIAVPVLSALISWDFSTAIVQILLGAAVLALGVSYRKELLCGSGGSLLVLGISYFLTTTFQYLTAAPWISLAALGMFAIFASSLVERHKGQLGQWRARYREHFHSDFKPSQKSSELQQK